LTTNQINSYGASPPQAEKTGATTKSTVNSQDFLKLLAAQMSNQDVMNPTDNTQYISQLAQFSSLQAMTEISQNSTLQLDAIATLSQISYAQYGASLIGKNVTVGSYDESKKYVEEKGIVTNVNFAGGTCTVTVNDKKYNLSSVMDVMSESAPTKPDPVTPTTPVPAAADEVKSATEKNAYTVGVPQSAPKAGTGEKV
jgi:flagellar basal-body rod modification protein FlgD